MLRLRRSGDRSRGQALVEFALAFPLFVLIVIGLFDAGRAVYSYNTVANSARAAARVAIVDQTPASIRARAIEMGVALNLSAGDVVLNPCTPIEAGCLYGVTVNYTYEPVTPILGNVFRPSISSTVQMPVEFVNP